jgi:Secretion system C-terminal sorting domain
MKQSFRNVIRILSVISVLLFSTSAFAVNFYVKTTGNNASAGTAWGTAFQTISYAISRSNDGDIISVEGGTYTEQLEIVKAISIIGSQNAGSGISRTVITAPAWGTMTSKTDGTNLNWTGTDKIQSSTFNAVIYVNASTNTTAIYLKGIDVNGDNQLDQTGTTMFFGIAFKTATGGIGGSVGDSVRVYGFKSAAAVNNAKNLGVGVAFFGKAAPTMSYVRIYDYRNAGIAVLGNSTSSLSSTVSNQPNPTIQDNVITGSTFSGTTSEDFIQAGILIANGGRSTTRRNLIWKNRCGTSDYVTGRFAYGMFLYDARANTIGDVSSTKSNGNLITDNEIGLYVRITTTTIPTSLYTVRQNVIAYNGNMTPCGKKPHYSVAASDWTTYGAVRFKHDPSTPQTLALASNAWGNAEANNFYSISPTGTEYTNASYNTTKVAFWRQKTEDNISATSPLSSPVGTTMLVNSSYSPGTEPAGAGFLNGMNANLSYGYSNFNSLRNAVYAAVVPATGSPATIEVSSNITEDSTIIINKRIRINGTVSTCASRWEIKLANGVDGPTFWLMGLHNGAASNDPIVRQPDSIRIDNFRIIKNNTQSTSWGYAFLVTGATSGNSTPLGTRLSGMAVDPLFVAASGYAISTTQNAPNTLLRYGSSSQARSVVNAKNLYRLDCSTIVGGTDVWELEDNTSIARVMYDNTTYVASCNELQDAIAAADASSGTNTIVNTVTLDCPTIYVENIATIRLRAQVTPSVATLTIRALDLNGSGTNSGGGTLAVCDFRKDASTSTININRINIWPPACLQNAVELIDNNASSIISMADGNSSNATLAFSESPINELVIAKSFDFMGSLKSSVRSVTPSAGNAKFSGIIKLNTGADIIKGNLGTFTSTNGTSFGIGDDQVQLSFTETYLNLINFNGNAIDMSLQLINSNSGSSKLALTKVGGVYSTENPTINTRVYMYGLANRGSSTGTITLNGSGDCASPSKLLDLSVTNIVVATINDCIQTSLGDAASQSNQGVGTSSSDGSGGTVDLSNLTYSQDVEIAKSVAFTNAMLPQSAGNYVTLRRGASPTGLTDFSMHVYMNQSSSWTSASNPVPTDAMSIVRSDNGGASIIDIAGYGTTDNSGAPLTGSSAGGVWQFNNVLVTKSVVIRGEHYNYGATDYTDCSVLDVDVVPSYNSLRNLSSETVIGSGSSTYSVGFNPVFDIQTDNVDILGFQFSNISSSNTTARAMVRDNNGYDNISVNNNIISISGAPTNIPGLVLASNTTSSKDLWTINNNRVIASGFSNNTLPLVDFRNDGNTMSGSATDAGLLISENVVNPSSTGASLIRLEDITGSGAEKIQVLNNYLNDAGENSLYLSTSGGVDRMQGLLIKGNSINTFGAAGTYSGLNINLNSVDPGTAKILVHNNVITTVNSNWAIDISYLAGMTINRIFIDSNRIEGVSGIRLRGIAIATDEISARFNYWNDNMGPIINSTPNNLPDRTYPSNTIYPFVSISGSLIEQDVNWMSLGANSPGAKFSILPVVISSTDRETGTSGTPGTCGWQPKDVMGPVLRMDAAGTVIKGTYNDITEARDDNSSYSFDTYWDTYSLGNRLASDEIWVLGTDNGNSTGYAGIEPSYPVEFPDPIDNTDILEPSAIRGYLGAQGLITAGYTGMISVTSNRNTGFEIDNLDVENRSSAAAVTVFDFANTSGDDYIHDCVFTDNNSDTPIQYTGIKYSGTSNGRLQVERDTTLLIQADNYTGVSIAGSNLASTTNISHNKLNTGVITNDAIGIQVTSAGTGLLVSNNILTSTSSTNYLGIDASGFPGSETINVNNNNIDANSVTNEFTGIKVVASGNSSDADITSNLIDGEGSIVWSGIVAQDFGGTNPSVQSNTLNGSTYQVDTKGITVENVQNSATMLVQNNSLSNANTASGTLYGVKTLGTGTSVTLNVLSNTLNGGSDTYYGVHSAMTGATTTTVENNTIDAVGSQNDFYGIYVEGISNTNYVDVDNNTIDNGTGATTGTYQGIYFDGTSNGANLNCERNTMTGGGLNFIGIQSAALNIEDFRVRTNNSIKSNNVDAEEFIGIDAGTFSTTNPEYVEIVDNTIGDIADIYENYFTGITGIGSNSASSSITISTNTIAGNAFVGGGIPPEFTGITFTDGGSTFTSSTNTISYDGSDISIVKGIELNNAAATSTTTISSNNISGLTYAKGSFTGINVNGATPTNATVTHSSNTIIGGGVVYTGITNTISNKSTLTSLSNEVTSERGANSIDEFTGITLSNFKASANIDVRYNEVGHDGSGSNTTNLSNTGWGKGIEIFANNVTSGNVTQNNVRFMSANTAQVAADAAKGAAIYVKNADGLSLGLNIIDGGNEDNSRGNNGIVLDGATGTNNFVTVGWSSNGNSIAQTTSLFQDKQVKPELGYGIKVFDKAGGAVNLQAAINYNTIGDNNSGCASGAIFVGGTSGQIKNGSLPFEITNNTIKGGNAANTANSPVVSSLGAAIQIATSVYNVQPSGGSIEISTNTIGGVNAGEGNSMDLAIGTSPDGIDSTVNANNLAIDVLDNTFRTHSQTIANSYDIADARTNAGANIRNIFGYQTGVSNNGITGVAGQGISGNNTFSFATILTGEGSPEDYTVAMSRTKDAKKWNTGEPVRISRILTSLNTGVRCDSANNTFEMRETAGYVIGNADTYWSEDFTFPDKRALLLGPAGSTYTVDMLAPSTGASVQTTGRQNKDVRGNIRFNVIGASNNAGKVRATENDKGDVYLQLGASSSDAPVTYRFHASALASLANVTGDGNSVVRATNIKALIDDADDDTFTANASSRRRTGVFRAGNGTQFTKEIAGAVSGSNLLEAYPNPANGEVTVNFIVPVQGFVSVDLYNTLGQKVTDITNGMFNADRYSASFNVSDLPSGTYQVRLSNELFAKSTSIVVIK